MILCAGEALIDMIPAPTDTGANGYVPHVGGAIFNTAVALGRLGLDVGLLTGISTDAFGARLGSALRDNNVGVGFVVQADRPTTLAFVELTDGHAEYMFYDENSAGRMLSVGELPAVGPEVTALYFGGISLACEPCADTYAALLAQEREGRAVMIDPNIRPDFIRDAERFRARLDAMMVQADIVKVSDVDLDWLVPGEGTAIGKGAALLERGPAVVIVTRGSEGATALLAQGGSVSVPALKAQVVDTVGAGDTFNAGVMAHLSRAGVLDAATIRSVAPEVMQAALAFGAQVAAVTVSRAGANPPWASEL